MNKRQAAALLRHPLTPLNHETTRRYLTCESTDGHRFSGGRYVMRDLGGQGLRYFALAVCDNCDVPIASTLLGNRSSMRVVA